MLCGKYNCCAIFIGSNASRTRKRHHNNSHKNETCYLSKGARGALPKPKLQGSPKTKIDINKLVTQEDIYSSFKAIGVSDNNIKKVNAGLANLKQESINKIIKDCPFNSHYLIRWLRNTYDLYGYNCKIWKRLVQTIEENPPHINEVPGIDQVPFSLSHLLDTQPHVEKVKKWLERLESCKTE